MQYDNMKTKLDKLLDIMVEKGGSDLHIKTDTPARARINGDIEVIGKEVLDKAFFKATMLEILSPEQQKKLHDEKELDGYYTNKSKKRFRFNFFWHLGGYGAVFRIIPTRIATLQELGLPKSVEQFANFERGLVLVTGTTGSGKSTTLAAIIDAINSAKKRHIITIEDPIEFVHNDKVSIIEQRNVGEHTYSFHNALKSALREDPDIILVGEMRDAQTVEIALHAANSGHLVLSTLHTLDAKETIDRIIGIFPMFEQNRIRLTLASVLQGILAQRLIKNKKGGRCVAIEIMVASERIKQLIKDNMDSEITDAIAQGSIYGMQSFDQALMKLYLDGAADMDEVLAASTKPDDLKLMISNQLDNTGQGGCVVNLKTFDEPLQEAAPKSIETMPILKLRK
ncbi:MAG: PilT/PilU family type 4a pilus ATPase [Campylobacterales bacterium]|nr:PilT/PilU family type 4a pilus ATPase [Campylobacterales bacterium]